MRTTDAANDVVRLLGFFLVTVPVFTVVQTMSEHQWYFVDSGDPGGSRTGPVDQSALVREIRGERLTPQSLVSSPTQSGGKWYRISQVPALARLCNAGGAGPNGRAAVAPGSSPKTISESDDYMRIGMRISPSVYRASLYDLFISYAHRDNQDQHAGRVTEVVDAIRRRFLKIVGRELRVFFDLDEIRTMQDWYERIQAGLVQSRMMVAILSPRYFASQFCRHEWAEFVETELAHALPGEGIAPIYVIPHPDFANASTEDSQIDRWVRDLKKRQYLHWADWWPAGQQSLEQAGVDEVLTKLVTDLRDRVTWSELRDRAPRNGALIVPSPHFKGRREEMRQLRHDLCRTRVGAITALHGIGGIGKSQLAFAYAWGYGAKYPGGRFLIPAAGLVGGHELLVSGLQSAVVDLGECIGVPVSPEERRTAPQAAFNRVAQAFAQGQPALFILDNVDDAGLLSPTVLDAALPCGSHLHVLATTRLPQTPHNRMTWLSVDALHPDDAEALLDSFFRISLDGDGQWQAARAIVKRLGGHPLALEVVGVTLRDRNDPDTPATLRQSLSYVGLNQWLADEGLSILDSDLAEHAAGKLAGPHANRAGSPLRANVEPPQ